MRESERERLSKKQISERLSPNESLDRRLFITPILDWDQIGAASIDLRLGTEFITTKRTQLTTFDAAQSELEIHRYLVKFYVPFHSEFILHPHHFMLGSTLEYIRLPGDLTASFTIRSSWGRAALVIATAPDVHPNYEGVLTLEMTNIGETPITLYPGWTVGQLSFTKINFEDKAGSKYCGSTGPEFPKLSKEEENWKKILRYSEYYCDKCCHKNPNGSKFCCKCGSDLVIR